MISAPHGPSHNAALATTATRLGLPTLEFEGSDLYFVRGINEHGARRIAAAFVDEPLQHCATVNEPVATPSDGIVIEVARRPGVTDRVAAQLVASSGALGLRIDAATGKRFVVRGGHRLSDAELHRLADGLLANPLIETWSTSLVSPGFASSSTAADHSPEVRSAAVEVVSIRALDATGLEQLNRDRGLALDAEELTAVQQWFHAQDRDPTTAELETIAQTWSEHCSHKTFRATIDIVGSGPEPMSLLDRLRLSTDEIVQHQRASTGRSFVVSAFDGNAGIVRFEGLPALAIKAETHNHPSAVEPFGGANTGVGGVVRDVLAAPAEPVALTDVLCFGPRNLPPALLPDGVLHPSIIEAGVVAGVADYGNKIGVPTVAGAVLYDPGFVGNPLVFCGCVGRVLDGHASVGEPRAGDRVVVIGGATGRDGIKGATFSSMTMDATTGEVAGASVQIGDPIVERLVAEVLVELLDRADPLCTAITDCGAGGLSSAVGEMADGIGADVQLDSVPRKYPGLAPWEVWLSEAQERMVLAVDPARFEQVAEACARRGVGCADIGVFTDTARVVVRSGSNTIVSLPTAFLHRGRPRRHMTAEIRETGAVATQPRRITDHSATLTALLSHPTIASKEAIIRRYDHEVRGATVLGPMSAPRQQGPSDGAVLAEPTARAGFAIGIGVNPQYGIFDCERMAWSAVDEALRNVVAAGADPSHVALLDNFSWGDPRRATTLGDLVSAVNGCVRAAHDFGAPFVSGKDSLNNEYEGADGQRRSIPPTLVITALALVPDADRTVSTGFVRTGNAIVLVGTTRDELRGSHLDLVLGADHGGSVPDRDPSSAARYAALHRLMQRGSVLAAHDLSEGGCAVALAESVIGGGLGADVDLGAVHADPVAALYSESNGRLLLEVEPHAVHEVCAALDVAVQIGVVSERTDLRIRHHDEVLIDVGLDVIRAAWAGDGGGS